MSAASLDRIMESASKALVERDYLECESLCLRALEGARRQNDWAYYCRILLPLQESRRFRRMIAAEGAIRLGSGDTQQNPAAWLGSYPAACIVLTRPLALGDAIALAQEARNRRLFIEVLFADNRVSDATWIMRANAGKTMDVAVELPAPASEWVDRWLVPSSSSQGAAPQAAAGRAKAADWFMDATEALGDQAIRHVQAPLGDVARVAALESCLRIVADHEKVHERLWEAARALIR
jgi:hypothetical protein